MLSIRSGNRGPINLLRSFIISDYNLWRACISRPFIRSGAIEWSRQQFWKANLKLKLFLETKKSFYSCVVRRALPRAIAIWVPHITHTHNIVKFLYESVESARRSMRTTTTESIRNQNANKHVHRTRIGYGSVVVDVFVMGEPKCSVLTQMHFILGHISFLAFGWADHYSQLVHDCHSLSRLPYDRLVKMNFIRCFDFRLEIIWN